MFISSPHQPGARCFCSFNCSPPCQGCSKIYQERLLRVKHLLPAVNLTAVLWVTQKPLLVDMVAVSSKKIKVYDLEIIGEEHLSSLNLWNKLCKQENMLYKWDVQWRETHLLPFAYQLWQRVRKPLHIFNICIYIVCMYVYINVCIYKYKIYLISTKSAWGRQQHPRPTENT